MKTPNMMAKGGKISHHMMLGQGPRPQERSRGFYSILRPLQRFKIAAGRSVASCNASQAQHIGDQLRLCELYKADQTRAMADTQSSQRRRGKLQNESRNLPTSEMGIPKKRFLRAPLDHAFASLHSLLSL